MELTFLDPPREWRPGLVDERVGGKMRWGESHGRIEIADPLIEGLARQAEDEIEAHRRDPSLDEAKGSTDIGSAMPPAEHLESIVPERLGSEADPVHAVSREDVDLPLRGGLRVHLHGPLEAAAGKGRDEPDEPLQLGFAESRGRSPSDVDRTRAKAPGQTRDLCLEGAEEADRRGIPVPHPVEVAVGALRVAEGNVHVKARPRVRILRGLTGSMRSAESRGWCLHEGMVVDSIPGPSLEREPSRRSGCPHPRQQGIVQGELPPPKTTLSYPR